MRQQFIEKFGAEDLYDHIVYCMPKDTGEAGRSWIAYAYRDTPFSYYNDDWCGSLTSKMHEIGHNLGVGHSGEAVEGPYEDRTCVMGVSFRPMDSPQECYNGWRHWSLGWFAQRQITVDPTLSGRWGGNLAAFVDYADIVDPADFAIINVKDLYLQYNLAEKYNWEVGERQNQVTIVQAQGDAEEQSMFLTALDLETPTFEFVHNGNTIVIEVCEKGTKQGKTNNVRYFKISVHEKTMTSACGITETDEELTQPPTLSPTSQSTMMPTPEPTENTTPEPTMIPTPDPTENPTPELL